MKKTFLVFILMLTFFTSGCSKSSSGPTCSAVTGTAWTPNVPGASASNHNPDVIVSSTTQSVTGPVMGLTDLPQAANQLTVSFSVANDLGAFGSVTLVGNVSGYPSDLSGGAYPMLVSLNDGTNEYINLNSTCFNSGLYGCAGGSCCQNGCDCTSGTCSTTRCDIDFYDSPHSMYTDFTHWEQHQAPNASGTNAPSTNMFPNCNWSGGNFPSSATDTTWKTTPACAASTLWSGGHLRIGNYTAKYVLVSDSYSTLSNHTAQLNVTIVKRSTTQSAIGGAMDVNIILVGNTTVNASRTAKGQQNLNTLVSNVASIYANNPPNIKLGSVNAIEWQCSAGGDTYASLLVSQMPAMFAASSNLVPSAEQGKSLNVFMVSSIEDDLSAITAGYTILGFDGAIGGPPLNGTAVSGVTVATFDDLPAYNVNCPASATICDATVQDSDFHEMSTAVAHELGHYFGLNHPSESDGSTHDMIVDTPICTVTDPQTCTANDPQDCVISINSCLNDMSSCSNACPAYNANLGIYCPSIQACQFNHTMWWTAKNFTTTNGAGDGNLFSADSSILMNYNSVIQ